MSILASEIDRVGRARAGLKKGRATLKEPRRASNWEPDFCAFIVALAKLDQGCWHYCTAFRRRHQSNLNRTGGRFLSHLQHAYAFVCRCEGW